MKKITALKPLIAIAVICLSAIQVHAQLDTCNVFLQGNYIVVGININGAYGSSCIAPAGYHGRSGGAGMQNTCTGICSSTQLNIGFIADPDKDGWTKGTPAYYGDFFLPGDPQEGWSLQVDTLVGNAWNGSPWGTCSGTLFHGTGTLTGKNISYNS